MVIKSARARLVLVPAVLLAVSGCGGNKGAGNTTSAVTIGTPADQAEGKKLDA